MKNKTLAIALLAIASFQLAACSTLAPQEPQVYGMPKSQFTRLTPAQQQQVMEFHNQFVSSQAMTGQQVAQLSPDNVQQVVISNNKAGSTNTTTVTTTSPSTGNSDLNPNNNTDLTTAATRPTSTPVIVNTNTGN